MYVTIFEASGPWAFPTDMLRYDGCFPADSEALDKIEASIRRELPPGNTTITLAQHHERKQHNVTIDRWASFGWRIIIKSTVKNS